MRIIRQIFPMMRVIQKHLPTINAKNEGGLSNLPKSEGTPPNHRNNEGGLPNLPSDGDPPNRPPQDQSDDKIMF
jgi:hypothetical protein